jgi:hypothetical protein
MDSQLLIKFYGVTDNPYNYRMNQWLTIIFIEEQPIGSPRGVISK